MHAEGINMDRRKAITSLAMSPLMAAAADAPQPQYYELRRIQLRNGTQPKRANEFFSKNFMSAARKAATGPVGVFNSVIGDRSPFLLVLITHATFADAEHFSDKLMADTDFTHGLEEFNKSMDPGFVRSENTLLRAFSGWPQLQVPPESKTGHFFEMRTYESNDEQTLRRKIGMFNQGESKVFQKLGMNPVFFAEAMFGSQLPHLTYMLAYNDWASRERLWSAFGSDPDWQKLRGIPSLSDPEIVSNTTNTILRGTAYSDIR
jgi:hypothetical protein